jgi:EpsI family protein
MSIPPNLGVSMRVTCMQAKSVVWIMAALMCGAAIAAEVLKPDTTIPPIGLKKVVPVEFGDWREVKEAGPIIDPKVDELIRKIYVETLARTYVNRDGDRIMLSMAYGSDQRGVLQAHRPEICYVAQGFKLETLNDGVLSTSSGDISVRRLTTSMGPRNEPVTYWLTMADNVVRNDFDKRMVQLRLLLTGQIPDGLLFRVSSIDRDAVHAFKVQQQFAADMMGAVPPDVRRRLSGLKPAGAT